MIYPHLVKTKTGAYRYRRRVPDALRSIIGKQEIVQSLKTRDERQVPLRLAKIHTEVEALFASARRDGNISDDVIFDQALTSLRALGIAPKATASFSHADRQDRAGAEDHLLEQAGYSSLDEFAEAYTGTPAQQLLSSKLGIANGSLTSAPPTLTNALRLYLRDRSRARDVSDPGWIRYDRERHRILNDFMSIIGKKHIPDLSRQDARAYLEHLEEKGYKSASVTKQLAFMRSLISFGIEEMSISASNPFNGLAAAKSAKSGSGRISFTYPDIGLLLEKRGHLSDDLRDILTLVVFTGARLGEITGLEKQDLSFNGSMPSIHIRYNSTRRIKNDSSIRILPLIHEALTALQKRWARLDNASATSPVFARYGIPDGSSNASAALGKWLRERVGISDRLKTIHSIRHTMKDALRDAGISRDIADMIQGHTAGDASSRYGTSELLEKKREGLQAAVGMMVQRI